MYAVSAPFELVLNFPLTFSKLKPAYGRAPTPDVHLYKFFNIYNIV